MSASSIGNPLPLKADAQADQPRISIRPRGSYVVTGTVKLVRRLRIQNAEGESVAWQVGDDYPAVTPSYRLCRCGNSKTKPFCDDSHERIVWDNELKADRAPGETRRRVFPGNGIIMTDDNSLCASFQFCDPFGGVWKQVKHSDDLQAREQLERQIALCPSGRLQYMYQRGGEPVEIAYEPMIAVIPNGPYWVLGGIPIEAPDGFVYEVRNRQLLCRCGQSQNKPFCDGTHWGIDFQAP